MKRYLLAALLVFASPACAQPAPKIPTSLPTLDWKCYASFTVAFAPPGDSYQELGLDGDNLKKPRIELHTVDNLVLKVIESPTTPMLRKEYAVELYKITQDFSRANPVYAWREELGYQVKIFAFNVNDRILSQTLVMKPGVKALNQTQVLVCR